MENVKTYYIYHIKGKKIGCTDNLERRISEYPKNTQYEILESHDDIFIASDREILLQKTYGYPVDKIPYWKTIEFVNKAYTKKQRPIKKVKTPMSNDEWLMVMKEVHHRMKEKGIGFYNPDVPLKAGLVVKEKYSIPIIAYEYPSMKLVGEFTSAKDCGKKLGLSNIGNIRNVLKGRNHSSKGYTFRYKHYTQCYIVKYY